MRTYLEYAPKVYERKGLFLPKEEVLSKTGFRSVYQFLESSAKEISKTGNSRNLKQYEVYSDELLIDCDDDETQIPNLQKIFQELGVGYKLYKSGGKGIHCEVETIPVLGSNVPYTQRKLIEKLGISCDLSLYRHSSLYRLPNTIHSKTGNKKELIECVEGGILEYSLLDPLASVDKFNIQGVEYNEELVFSLSNLVNYINHSPGLGNRYCTLWKLAKGLYESGVSQRAAAELIFQVNLSWDQDKHTEDEVLRAVRGAYE